MSAVISVPGWAGSAEQDVEEAHGPVRISTISGQDPHSLQCLRRTGSQLCIPKPGLPQSLHVTSCWALGRSESLASASLADPHRPFPHFSKDGSVGSASAFGLRS